MFQVHVSWDLKKDEEHKERRGKGFQEVSKLLELFHVIMPNDGYDDQFKAIGMVDGSLWTLIIEFCEDDLGELIWCSNF